MDPLEEAPAVTRVRAFVEGWPPDQMVLRSRLVGDEYLTLRYGDVAQLVVDKVETRLDDLIDEFGIDAVMNYLTGTVGSAPARTTDPHTSHKAAKTSPDLRRFSGKSQVGRLLASFHHDDQTAMEATYSVVGSEDVGIAKFEGCRRRVSDLVKIGYVAPTGYTRCNPGSSDEAIVWGITTAGLAALKSIGDTGWSQ